ncbi:MAG: hypothetical protein AB7V18_19475 [Pyrinomonadaceae bacterium]
MKMKLAEALLRRKELNEKVAQTKTIKTASVYEVKSQRMKAHEGIDEVIASVPKLDLAQVTSEYDHYARGLRLIDAAIQQANWTVEIDVDDKSMRDWESLKKTE